MADCLIFHQLFDPQSVLLPHLALSPVHLLPERQTGRRLLITDLDLLHLSPSKNSKLIIADSSIN